MTAVSPGLKGPVLEDLSPCRQTWRRKMTATPNWHPRDPRHAHINTSKKTTQGAKAVRMFLLTISEPDSWEINSNIKKDIRKAEKNGENSQGQCTDQKHTSGDSVCGVLGEKRLLSHHSPIQRHAGSINVVR